MIFFPTQNVLSGESGDDQNLNNPKELKIDINDVLETLKIRMKNNSKTHVIERASRYRRSV